MKYLAMGFMLLAINGSSLAQDNSTIDAREQQRERFLEAERAVKRRQFDDYQQLKATLQGYPLLPYLELLHLELTANPRSPQAMQEFLLQAEQSPLSWQARHMWLDRLAAGRHYQQFMAVYEAPGLLRHQCFYITAQLQQQGADTTAILSQVADLWLTGESLPKACDPVLAAWMKAGYRTDSLVWRRIALAAEGGQHTLIPYLQKMLPQSMHYLAEHYHRVRRDPAQVSRSKWLRGDFPTHESQIVAYGLSRLIWRDPDRAIRFIENLPVHINFTAEQYLHLRQTFAIALSLKGHTEASAWLARLEPTEHNDATLHWQLAEWLRHSAWTQIMGFVPRLPDAQRESDQWQYWLARSMDELGHHQVAQQLWRRIAQQRSYYGFLAAAKTNQRVNLSKEPLTIAADELQRIRLLPGVQRAYELRALDRDLDARREWNSLLEHLDEAEQQALAVIASEWGWHAQAIYTLGKLQAYDAVAQRFPAAFLEQHTRFAEAASIDVNWALAISRRESSFQPNARSHAGAYGVMQLLPRTASAVDRRQVSTRELFNPTYNIRLGTRYLADLQRRLGDNWLLATAAYNAGIYRVYDWLPAQPMDADRWVELIPYAETRNYVKNVLAYQQIYRTIRNNEEQPKLFSEIVPMQISVLR